MSKFESVSVVKAANVYFDGNVTSRSVEFADGSLPVAPADAAPATPARPRKRPAPSPVRQDDLFG